MSCIINPIIEMCENKKDLFIYKNEINNDESNELLLQGIEYEKNEEYDKMIECYELAIYKDNNISAMINLAYYYFETEEDFDLTKKYYNMAIDFGEREAMFGIAIYYEYIEDNYDEMKKYYLMAIDQNHVGAMTNLALYYFRIEKNYELMKKYYLMAIEYGEPKAMFGFGIYYNDVEQDFDSMIKYYMMAIDKGNSNAMLHLGFHYYKINNYELAKKYLGLANNNNHPKAPEMLEMLLHKF